MNDIEITCVTGYAPDSRACPSEITFKVGLRFTAMVLEADRNEWGLRMLAVMRIVLGFMMIWAFLDKMFGLGMLTTPEAAVINGGSPTEYYLSELVSGVFAGFFHAIAGNPVVDFLLMAGLLLVGIGLVLGVASRL